MVNRESCFVILSILLAILLTIISLMIPFKLLLSFDALYQFDVNTLQLDKRLQMSSGQLMTSYKRITRYLENESIRELTIPGFKMSEQGRVHFKDVKMVFLILDRVLFISVCLLAMGLLLLLQRRCRFIFLKWAANGLLIVPVLLAVPCLFSFESVFIQFHRLLFRNQYWMFDPITDPVINALPQEFFFHCGLVFLLLILCMGGFYHAIYYMIRKRYKGGF